MNYPIIEDIKAYKGSTFDFSFTFVDKDSGDLVDITILDNIKLRIKKLFNLSIQDGTLSIKNSNKLVGRIDAEDMKVAKRTYYYDIKITESNGWVTAVTAGKFTVINSSSNQHETSHNITLEIEPFT
jgi:hypothetical protein